MVILVTVPNAPTDPNFNNLRVIVAPLLYIVSLQKVYGI
ncbi:hypothetical protein MNB_SV-6-1860 [hydrothermal vent metagenome]|uniref:Uncharacterized protein n=1 Tax=hydrothermal vent metagenome TaxID=652676 RepID=A0A1W1C3W1_9ZZZZ